QHRRPEGAVESCNVLADHVNACRPDSAKSFWIGAVTDAGDVVEKRVEPDVDGLLGIKWDLDSPGKPLARDGDVSELGFDEVDHLITAAIGLNEFRVCRIVRKQALAVCRQAKEVIVFFKPEEFGVGMIGAATVSFFDFLFGLESLAAVAIVALVDA